MTRKLRVSWFHTEAFERVFEVDDDFDLDDEEFDEDDNPLLDQILNLEQPELTAAFAGCTARAITDITPIEEEA